MTKDVVIVIPAYEPPKQMLSLLKKLKRESFQIIVVDDGSGELYAPIFKKALKDAIVLTHSKNQGKGAALKTAFRYIEKQFPSSMIVTMDCDGQHTIQDVKKLVAYVQTHENELVLGKRLRKKNTPLRSKIGNVLTRFVYFLVTGYPLYDTQTGLRAFSSKYLAFLKKIPGKRFEYEMNMILYSASYMKIKEIEIETIYIDHNSGSHFNTIQDSIRIYKAILKFISPVLSSFLIAYFLFFIAFWFTKKLIFSSILADLVALLGYQILRDTEEKTPSLKIVLLGFLLLLKALLLEYIVKEFLFSAAFVKFILEMILLFSFFFARQIEMQRKN